MSLRFGNIAFQKGEVVKVNKTGYVGMIEHLQYPIIGGLHSPDQVTYWMRLPKSKVTDPTLTGFKHSELTKV